MSDAWWVTLTPKTQLLHFEYDTLAVNFLCPPPPFHIFSAIFSGANEANLTILIAPDNVPEVDESFQVRLVSIVPVGQSLNPTAVSCNAYWVASPALPAVLATFCWLPCQLLCFSLSKKPVQYCRWFFLLISSVIEIDVFDKLFYPVCACVVPRWTQQWPSYPTMTQVASSPSTPTSRQTSQLL